MRLFIKKNLRWLITNFMFYSGSCILLKKLKIKPHVRILMYHHVCDILYNPFNVSIKNFDDQINFLVHNYTILSLTEVLDSLNQGKNLPQNTIVITIDDGFKDAYTNAYPILKKYEATATVFLSPDFIISKKIENDKNINNNHECFLSWENIKEMSENGISFGSHTLSHSCLTKVDSKEAFRQISESKKIIERKLNKKVILFAYPFGIKNAFNEEIKKMVINCGYVCACSAINGTNNGDTDLFSLRRTKIEAGDSLSVFKKILSGSLDIWVLVDKFFWFLQTKKYNYK